MKILYALQGTGNGHVARARALVPLLSQRGEVDVLVAGTQSQIDLGFPVRFKKFGLTMKYNSSGGVSYWKSLVGNRPLQFLKDVWSLPVKDYDLVIIDFEAITSYACLLRGVKSLQLSHQAAYWSESTPRPTPRVWHWEFVLKYMSPSPYKIGFHFNVYDTFILPPIIRSDIRELTPTQEAHYTVYLPAYSAGTLARWFERFPNESFTVFTKENNAVNTLNTVFYRVDNKLFTNSLSRSRGLICSAGFEGPAEAMYLGKKLLITPIKGQYEQAANAICAAGEGATVFRHLNEEAIPVFERFFQSKYVVKKAWPDFAEGLVACILDNAKKGKALDDISALKLH